jgi:hypothetical protein
MSCLDPRLFTNSTFVENFRCDLGNGVLFDPVIDQCGHSYCRNCHYALITLHDGICQISKKKCNNQISLKKNTSLSFLQKEELLCPSNQMGCNWQGRVADLDVHLYNECQFSILTCKLIQCRKSNMTKEDYEHHVGECSSETISCNDCELHILRGALSIHVQIHCLEVKVQCLHCKLVFPRKNIEMHQNGCPRRKFSCQFASGGCDFIGEIDEIASHLSQSKEMTKHITIQAQEIHSLKQQVSSLTILIIYLMAKENSQPQPTVNIEKLVRVDDENDIFGIDWAQ